MNEHPITPTPTPELVASLRNSAPHGIRDAGVTRELHLIAAAYAAGAEQELEACLGHLIRCGFSDADILRLRTTRRPQSLSLKEQALEAQRRMWSGASNHDDWDLVRRALEQLPD